jgi:hypothetical protein
MAPASNSTAAPTQAAAPPDVQRIEASEEDSGLPGMKRGIAIGVACSVTILLVALLSYIAIRRRRRLAAAAAAEAAKIQTVAEVEGDGGFWPAAPEKPRHTEAQQMGVHRGPPVEADAQTIHELDAQQIPELPGNYASHELEAGRKKTQGEDLDEYAQTQRQWEMWKYTPEEHHEQPYHKHSDSKHTLPELTVSSPSPQTPYGLVSPLGHPASNLASQRPARYDAPSPNASPSPYTPATAYTPLSTYPPPSLYDAPSPARSPLEEVHLLTNRNNGHYDMR